MAKITIYGEPVGKLRPRTFRRGGRFITFTPDKTREYEKMVRDAWEQSNNPYLANKPIKATIMAFYSIPKSNSKKLREKKLQLEVLPCIKPDLDNISKSILDALNNVAYDDDSQVVNLTACKLYGEIPRVEVVLEEI